MKLLSFSALITLGVLFLFTSCGNDGDSARDAALENAGGSTTENAGAATTPSTNVTPNDAATPKAPEPPQNAAGVWHYTCPNGCEGGGGAAGPCAKCGATLAHNSAYHAGTTPPAATTPAGNANLTPIPSPNTPAATPEPAQNAAGVWHYTCPSGCAGGAGTASACPKCGATLAHNTAYHQ